MIYLCCTHYKGCKKAPPVYHRTMPLCNHQTVSSVSRSACTTALWLVLAVALAFFTCMARAENGEDNRIEVLTLDTFQDAFPAAEFHQSCYTMVLDDCRIVAVPAAASSSSEKEIGLIIVSGRRRAPALSTAEKLVKTLNLKATISPFMNNKPAVAIVLSLSELSELSKKHPLKVLFQPENSYKDDLKFVELQGTQLKVRFQYRSVRRFRHNQPNMEMTVDIGVPYLECVSFQPINERMDDSKILSFATYRFWWYSVSETTLSTKSKKSLLKELGGQDLLSYSSSVALILKGKVYRIGTPTALRSMNKSRNESDFDMPEQKAVWPDGDNASSEEDDTEDDNSSKQNPPANTSPKPSVETKPTVSPLNLSPAEAMRQYIEGLQIDDKTGPIYQAK